MNDICNVNYDGKRGVVNCTVSHPEVVRARETQKKELERSVREHQEYRRVPRGKRKVKHILPLEESYQSDGSMVATKPTTTTERTNN